MCVSNPPNSSGEVNHRASVRKYPTLPVTNLVVEKNMCFRVIRMKVCKQPMSNTSILCRCLLWLFVSRFSVPNLPTLCWFKPAWRMVCCLHFLLAQRKRSLPLLGAGATRTRPGHRAHLAAPRPSDSCPASTQTLVVFCSGALWFPSSHLWRDSPSSSS